MYGRIMKPLIEIINKKTKNGGREDNMHLIDNIINKFGFNTYKLLAKMHKSRKSR